MSTSFTEKQLVVSITLDGEKMSFPGFATTVHIQKQGAPELPEGEHPTVRPVGGQAGAVDAAQF